MTQPPPPGVPGVDEVRHVDLSDENPVRGVRPWPACRVDLNGEPVGEDVGRPSTSRDVRWPRRLPRPTTLVTVIAAVACAICLLAVGESDQLTQAKQLGAAGISFGLGGLVLALADHLARV